MTIKDIQNLHFLIVEDEPFQRESLALLLGGIGARHVRQAENGRAALDLIQSREAPVDVLLCDIAMPEMDGMALLRGLGQAHSQAAVILVSGLDNAMRDSVTIMAKAYGVNILGAMPKPPSRGKLLELLAQHDAQRNTVKRLPPAAIPREEIAAALQQGEFVPYFQPKVDMATGRVTGVEALARWVSPTRGLLAPGFFLEAVEKHGLMDSLTWIVLAQCAAVGRQWQARGLQLTISVNLSLSSLARVELAERIHEVVTKQGIASGNMILEVTESAAMQAVGPSLENLARLRLLGFGLSIDDYGTGYSSLQQLARVPFTELKVDQSFVRAAAQQETTRIVVESSLDIARKLGLKATAEGIENAAQWEMLKAMGCDIAQGYFIAKPMPAADIPGWAASWKAPAPTAPAQAANILLVEDEPFQREIYAGLLAQLGFGRVDAAGSVDEALQRLAETPYGIVISDVELPDRSGLDLVRMIRACQTPARPDTRILLLSSHNEQEVVFKSIVLDINGFVTKPAKAHALHEAIRQARAENFAPRPAAYYLQAAANGAPLVSASIMHPVAEAPSRQDEPPARRVRLISAQAGMVLAKPILTHDHTLVLNRGQLLTQTIINRLLDILDSLASKEVWVEAAPPA